MTPSPTVRVGALVLFAWTLVASCSSSKSSTPSGCRIDTAVICTGDFVGYSCNGEQAPSRDCSDGTLEASGEIGYCCPTAPL